MAATTTPSSKGKQTGSRRGKAPGSRKTQIKKGEVRNPKGRPPGSRNKLSEDFISALSSDFDEHGVQAIKDVRENYPQTYVKVVADLVPKDVNLKHDASDTFKNIWMKMNGIEGKE